MAISGLQDHPEGRKLWDYWVHGEGSAKIGWGAPADYARCLVELGKYTPNGAHGLCAEMHIAATGMTTTEHAALLKGKGKDHPASAVEQLAARVQGRD